MNLRARMKPGVRPIILGVTQVPEYPHYWEVPDVYAAAVAALVDDRQAEYAPELQRAPDGSFAVPGLQTVQRAPQGASGRFQRKGGK